MARATMVLNARGTKVADETTEGFKVMVKDRWGCLIGGKPSKINTVLELANGQPLTAEQISAQSGVSLKHVKSYFEWYGVDNKPLGKAVEASAAGFFLKRV